MIHKFNWFGQSKWPRDLNCIQTGCKHSNMIAFGAHEERLPVSVSCACKSIRKCSSSPESECVCEHITDRHWNKSHSMPYNRNDEMGNDKRWRRATHTEKKNTAAHTQPLFGTLFSNQAIEHFFQFTTTVWWVRLRKSSALYSQTDKTTKSHPIYCSSVVYGVTKCFLFSAEEFFLLRCLIQVHITNDTYDR